MFINNTKTILQFNASEFSLNELVSIHIRFDIYLTLFLSEALVAHFEMTLLAVIIYLSVQQ